MKRDLIVQNLQNELPHLDYIIDAKTIKEKSLDRVDDNSPLPFFIIYPRSSYQVQDIVLFAVRYKVSIITVGGKTGLSGGLYTSKPGIAINFEKMNRLISFTRIDKLIHCQAGMTTHKVQTIAASQNLYYPIRFASTGSSQIGGNIATNAGGVHVIKYGMTRNWVAGLTIVTGEGAIIKLNKGLIKNATGYSLLNLMIGSEGTLGICTEAQIKLVKVPKPSVVGIIHISKLFCVGELLSQFSEAFDLVAFELISSQGMWEVAQSRNIKTPIGTNEKYANEWFILYEIEQESNWHSKLSDFIDLLYELQLIQEDIIAVDSKDKEILWSFREEISSTISKYKPFKNDISVRPSYLASFILELEAILIERYPHSDVIWFGHIGDGNLHINIINRSNLNPYQFNRLTHEVTIVLFELVQKYQGSISAEHGLGTIKKKYQHYSRSNEEINIMQKIKASFDPHNLLNPNVIFSAK